MPTAHLLFLLALLAAAPAAAAEIGKATAIAASVTGDATGSHRSLKTGDDVFENESIRTDRTGAGQFEFLDRTRLAVGPASTVKLDRFVYSGNRTAKSVAIELGRGAFRFFSGGSDRRAYRIRTVAATIGVRGTTFDLYVADSGALCIAMIEGGVQVCPRGVACRSHSLIGRYLIVTPDSTFWLLDRWDGALLGGASFATAMPFLANQEGLAPRFRAPESIVSRYRSLPSTRR
jgi:ferric-dicitrate binding protein FerR (iron transport regulator)